MRSWCRRSCTTTCRSRGRRRCRSQATGLEPIGSARRDQRRRSTSGAERRDDWRFAAQGAGRGHGDGDGEDRKRRRCRRTADPGAAVRHPPRGRHAAARSSAPAKRPPTVDDARVRRTRPARSISRVAGAVAGRIAARRARLPDRLSVRLHRADALELPAEPARDARADRAEARADRAAVGARSAGLRRPAAARRLSSTTTAGGDGGRRTATIRS